MSANNPERTDRPRVVRKNIAVGSDQQQGTASITRPKRPLFEVSYVVMAGVKSPWVRRKKIRLAELMEEPWVLPSPDSAVGSFLGEAFRATGLSFPRVAVVAFAYEVRMSLLATNRYLTILPESTLWFPATHPRIKMVPVELPLRPMPIGIITLKNRTLSPAAQFFVDAAREMAKPLAKRKRQSHRSS